MTTSYRFAGITLCKDQELTLILYDGHISHISLTLSDWAKNNNVALFVLPSHSSHLALPLDVVIFVNLLKYDVRLLITPLVSCGHCVDCPSTYGF
jgi:hypothetical protein